MSRHFQSAKHLRQLNQPAPQMHPPSEMGWFDKRFNKNAQRENAVANELAQRDAIRFENEEAAYLQNQQRRAEIADNNERYQDRRRMMAGLPAAVRFAPGAQTVGDAIVDVNRMGQGVGQRIQSMPVVPTVGGAALITGLGAAGVGAGSGAFAYGQLVEEGLPTDGMSVAGRMAMNAAGTMPGFTGVGADPLAEARFKVQQAQKQLGSDAVLEAVVLDELDANGGVADRDKVFDQMVDAKADQLMQEGKVDGEGNFTPMPANQAYELAYKIVKINEGY